MTHQLVPRLVIPKLNNLLSHLILRLALFNIYPSSIYIIIYLTGTFINFTVIIADSTINIISSFTPICAINHIISRLFSRVTPSVSRSKFNRSSTCIRRGTCSSPLSKYYHKIHAASNETSFPFSVWHDLQLTRRVSKPLFLINA